MAFEDQQIPTPSGLQQWLAAQIQAANQGENTNNAALLRLESDENLVKIITMHAAKGLQYPIVFCPYAFKAGQDSSKDEWHIVHHENATELVHKTQLNESDSEKNTQEHLSEDLRLLYVALTRAEEQLIVYMGEYEKSQHNPFAYLLNWEKSKDGISFQAAWQTFIQQQNPDIGDFLFQQGLTQPEQHQNSSGCLSTHNTPAYQAEIFVPRHFQFIQHTSFTGLARQIQHNMEAERIDLLPELDSAEHRNVVQVPTSDIGIEHFPTGTQAGMCLHSLLEHYHPKQSIEKQQELAIRILKQYGFDAALWAETVLQCAHNAVYTPLLPKLNLAMLSEQERLDEMGFVFHSTTFNVERLRVWLAQPHLGLDPVIIRASKQLAFHHIHGFINGFIDVFVHTHHGESVVIDYKSNYLGSHISDYHQGKLNQVIAEHHYYLQALIYAIACARYLKTRQVSISKIAIRYLFLRGLDGMSEHGIWQWDISWTDLQEWL